MNILQMARPIKDIVFLKALNGTQNMKTISTRNRNHKPKIGVPRILFALLKVTKQQLIKF